MLLQFQIVTLLSLGAALCLAQSGPDDETFRLTCERELSRAAADQMALEFPVNGIASTPERLWENLIQNPEGPDQAWWEMKPLWWHSSTVDLPFVPLSPEDRAYYRDALLRAKKNRSGFASPVQHLTWILATVFRIEKEIAIRHVQELKRLKKKEDPQAEAKEKYTYAVLQSLMAKFVELYYFPGSNWPHALKEPIARQVDRVLPDWLLLNGIATEPETVDILVGSLSAHIVTEDSRKKFARLRRTAKVRNKSDFHLAFSVDLFSSDTSNTVLGGSQNLLLLEPHALLDFGNFNPRLDQNRTLIKNLRRSQDKRALPGQARVDKKLNIPGFAPSAAQVVASAPAMMASSTARRVALARLFTSPSLGKPGYGIGMASGRAAFLTSLAGELQGVLDSQRPSSRLLQALLREAGHEAALLELALAATEEAYLQLQQELEHTAAILLMHEAVDLEETFVPEARVSALTRAIVKPDQATGIKRKYILSGTETGAWFGASDISRADEHMHTLIYFPQAKGLTVPSLRVRIYTDGYVEIEDDTVRVQFPLQGNDLILPGNKLVEQFRTLDAALQYRPLREEDRRWSWELLTALSRRFYVVGKWARHLRESSRGVLPALHAYWQGPSEERARAVIAALREIGSIDLDRTTLRTRHTSTTAAIVSQMRTIPVFASLREDILQSSEEERARQLPRTAMSAILMDSQRNGWRPTLVDPDQTGFDILASRKSDATQIKRIEVKSLRSLSDLVQLTPNELQAALDYGDSWFLAVVSISPTGELQVEYFKNPFANFTNPGLKFVPLDLRMLRARGFLVQNPWE